MKTLNRLFYEALDELDITFDIYYEIERHKKRCLTLCKWLLTNGINNGSILVLSSYPRSLVMILEKLGYSAVGIGITQKPVMVKEESRITVSEIDRVLKDIPHKFDVIVCDDLLQILVFPVTTILMLKDKLVQDGILLITTPNAARGALRFSLLMGRNIYKSLTDVINNESMGDESMLQELLYREFTLTEVEGLMSIAGFSVIQRQYFIGKNAIDRNILMPPMTVPVYLARQFNHLIQILFNSLRSYIFVSARRLLAVDVKGDSE